MLQIVIFNFVEFSSIALRAYCQDALIKTLETSQNENRVKSFYASRCAAKFITHRVSENLRISKNEEFGFPILVNESKKEISDHFISISHTQTTVVASLFKRFAVSSQTVLMCGLSAGFSSVFGTPLAGAIFGLEVLQVGSLPSQRFVFCLISSLIAKLCVDFMGYQHSHFAGFTLDSFSLKEFPMLILLGLIFGLVARLFILAMHHFQPTARKILKSP